MAKKKKPRTAQERLRAAIDATLAGGSASPVMVKVRLEGPAAYAWRDLREAAGPLAIDDAGIFAILLRHGAVAVQRALQRASPESEED